VDNVFECAARIDLEGGLLEALQRKVLVAAIGPVTSEALERHGVHADLSPEQPKLGALVECLALAGARLQYEKRRQQP
jgi:uroporphyrinogen-III synthase